MALVKKPHGSSTKKYNYKLLIENERLSLAERVQEDEAFGFDPEYLDVMLLLMYMQSEHSVDIRGVVRILLSALLDRYSKEEIQELLIQSENSVFTTSEEDGITIDTESVGERSGAYASLLLSLAKNSSVASDLIGEKHFFLDKNQFQTLFADGLEEMSQSQAQRLEQKEEPVPTEAEGASEEAENTENGADESRGARYKEKDPKQDISKLIDRAKGSGMSGAAFSFVESVIDMVSAKERSEEEVEQYICTMLNGLGLMIPEITEYEIKAMIEHITQYIKTRGEKIMEKQIAFFERSEQ